MMRKFVVALASVAFVSGGSPVHAQSGDEIIQQVENQPSPKSSAVRMKMVLISQRGDKTFEQERTVEMFAKRDAQEGVRTLLRFKEPKDVEGVALLVRENKDAPNDQWLYMPALKQDPKRISGGQRNASFLGTDFTFADLEGRDPDQWDHKLLREETIDGHDAWVIESTPKKDTETQYTRLVQWIRKDVKLPVKIEFYDKRGLLKKLNVEQLDKIGEFWTATRTRMENVRKKHATVLEILEQKNNIKIPEKIFTTREMKRG